MSVGYVRGATASTGWAAASVVRLHAMFGPLWLSVAYNCYLRHLPFSRRHPSSVKTWAVLSTCLLPMPAVHPIAAWPWPFDLRVDAYWATAMHLCQPSLVLISQAIFLFEYGHSDRRIRKSQMPLITLPVHCVMMTAKIIRTVQFHGCAQWYTGWAKKVSHCIWLSLSLERLNWFAWFLVHFNIVLFWTHLLSLYWSTFIIPVAPPSNKISFSLAKSSKTTAFKCPCL